MNSIGVVGTGFVGTAMVEGMRHSFEVYGYDKKLGWSFANAKCIIKIECKIDPYEHLLKVVDGPIFVCVPTPMNLDGSCNTDIVKSVVLAIDKAAEKIQSNMCRVVCIKSTVPPGTTQALNDICKNIVVCFNPEFLRESNPIEDFKNQNRIIVGGPREGTSILKQIYDKAYPDVPLTKTGSSTAEMIKYVTNTFLAVKVALSNEFKQICDKLDDVDYDKVIEYATKDNRLGNSHWAVPGSDGKLGFGGSCFPKDLNALINVAKELEVTPSVMVAAWRKNLEVRPEKDWERLKGRAVNE